MKKNLLFILIGIYTQINFCNAQYNFTLDTSFNNTGLLTAVFQNGYDKATVIQKTSNNTYSIAALGAHPGNDFMLLRYHDNGVIDTSLNHVGYAYANFNNQEDVPHAMKVQSDGKLVIAGETYDFVGTTADIDFAICRFNTNGSLDNTFGTGGKATFNILGGQDLGFKMELQADGKILMVGAAADTSDFDGIVIRLKTNGTLDSTFATNGIYRYDINQNEFAQDITVDAQNNIIVSGQSTVSGAIYNAVVFKLDNQGNLINTFGNQGTMEYSIAGTSIFILTQKFDSQGNIVITGQVEDTTSHQFDYYILKLQANGTPVNNFGNNGMVTLDLGGNSEMGLDINFYNNLILVTGQVDNANNTDFITLCINNATGELDTNNNVAGTIITDFGLNDVAFSSIIDNNKLVLAGGKEALNQQSCSIALARYNIDFLSNTVNINNEKINFEVAPNPFNNQIKISTSEIIKPSWLSVYNNNGNLIKYIYIKDNATINTSQWANGIYYVKINSTVKKIVKQ